MSVSVRICIPLASILLVVMTQIVCDASQQPPPNVLFLVCDDLNCDLSCYGHPLVKTPNIDALAARGVRFENAHCQYPLCGPSRASFMTGMYPDQTLVRRNAIYLREHTPDVLTLPQVFRSAGYFATRIGKLYHYNVPKHIGTAGHDDPYSWNYTINPRGRDKDDEDLIFSLTPGSFGGTMSWLAAEGTDDEQTDAIAAAEAARQLQKYADSTTPFFLAVGLYRPHTPYVAPTKYFEMYPTNEIRVPTIPDGYLDTLPKPAAQSLRRKREQVNLNLVTAKQAIQAYYASITFADAQIGRIVNALDRFGLTDNTIIVFTSDHGYHMGEHGYYQKTTLFENATRVPLIIAGPGVSATGETTGTMAEMVDIYRTVTDLAGLQAPESVSGVSLVPALNDAAATVRESAFTQFGRGYSIRTPEYRYTEWGRNGDLGRELYDRRADPDELHNLGSDDRHKAKADELSVILRQRIEQANRPPVGVKQIRFEDTRRVPQPNP